MDEQLIERIAHLERKIRDLKDPTARRDMQKMFRNLETIQTEISRESVECRRRQRVTVRYQELLVQCEQLLEEYERTLTFAILLRG